MEILAKNISNIVVSEVNIISNKVKGLNFLEILKIKGSEELRTLINAQKFPFDEGFNLEENIDNNFSTSINYFVDSLAVTKKYIEYDTLFISLSETINFDIYLDKKKYTSLMLYKNNGISLPKGSVVNFFYNKNVLLLEIQNKNVEQTLTS